MSKKEKKNRNKKIAVEIAGKATKGLLVGAAALVLIFFGGEWGAKIGGKWLDKGGNA